MNITGTMIALLWLPCVCVWLLESGRLHRAFATMALRWRQMPRGQALAFLVLLVWAVVYGGDKDEQQGGEQDAAEPPANDIQVDTPPAGMMDLYEPAADAFVFTDLLYTNGVVDLGVHLPDSASFQVDIFSINRLTDFPWSLLTTTSTMSDSFRVQFAFSASNAFFRAGNADVDTDNDGIPDDRELLIYGTGTNQWDTDGDGMPDGLELAYGLSPTNASDALTDPDDDGFLTVYEVLHSGNPFSAGSVPTPNIVVTNGGPETIQHAINRATHDYDIVGLTPGTYTNTGNYNLNFYGKKITVTSIGSADETVIQCVNDRGFLFDHQETRASVLRGVTIKNGHCHNSIWSTEFGAGICCDSTSPTIWGCIVEDCNSSNGSNGGGVGSSGGSPAIWHCVIRNNLADNYGGGIYLFGGTPLVSDCLVSSNTATVSGAGLYADGPSLLRRLTVSGNTTVGSGSYNNGGGIQVRTATAGAAQIQECSILANHANSHGGGLAVNQGEGSAPVICRDSVIANNTCTIDGGGIFMAPAATTYNALIVSNTAIVGNIAWGGEGGGCYAYNFWQQNTTAASFTRCLFQANTTFDVGGALRFYNTSLAVDRCTFVANTAPYGAVVGVQGSVGLNFVNCYMGKNTGNTDIVRAATSDGNFQNCTFANNDNTNATTRDLLYNNTCDLKLRNTILWNPALREINNVLPYNRAYDAEAIACCVAGGYTAGGSTGIVTNNPLLFAGYLLLSTNSSCVGAGVTNGLPGTDLDGNPRQIAAPDIGCGAYDSADTDDDGLQDAWERAYFGSLDYGSADDPDNDGFSNLEEFGLNTSPVIEQDSDGDGMPDAWENMRGLDPDNPADAAGDWNDDGISNIEEFNRRYLTVMATIQDADQIDDCWELFCNGRLVAACGPQNNYLGSGIVRVSCNTIACFTLRRPQGGQYGGTDEYAVNFASIDNATNLPWMPLPGNAPMTASLPYGPNGEPPDMSEIHWSFRVPANQLIDKTDPGTDANKTVDPINTIDGSITLDEIDISLPCPAFDLDFQRTYNSRLPVDAFCGLGPGWRHSWDWSLTTETNTAYGNRAGDFVVLRSGNAQAFWFLAQTNGTYLAPEDAPLILAAIQNGYRVTWPGGNNADFSTVGALVRLADGFGMGLSLTYDQDRLTQVAHDNGRTLTFAYAGDRLTRVDVDSPANPISLLFGYDASNRLAGVTRLAGSLSNLTNYAYENTCNALTQRVNAAGHVFAYGVACHTQTPAVGGAPASLVARGTSMALNGYYYSHTLSYTNPGGFCTRVTYNRGDTNTVLDYTYDPAAMRLHSITGPGVPGTAAWSNTFSRFAYDPAGNIITNTVQDGPSGEMLTAIATYDARHNILANGLAYGSNAVSGWTMNEWNTDDTLAATTDPAGHRAEILYTNGLPSLIRACTVPGVGYETRLFYDANGLPIAVTNANGHGLANEYDNAGYLRRMIPALGPDATFERDDLGRVIAIIQPGENGPRTNSVVLDGVGRVLAATRPDGRSATFGFNKLGNLTNQVDFAGRTNTLTWLPAGHLESSTRWLGTTRVTISNAFDRQFNSLKITDPLGRIVESYKLDMQDRPVNVTNILGQTMTVNYGVGDRVCSLARFDGTVVSNYFDSDGRLAEMRMLGTAVMPGVTNTFAYFADGSLVTAFNAMGVVSNSFDAVNRLAFTTGAIPMSAVSYGYFPAGQVSNVTTVAGTTTYTLDAADRLTGLTNTSGYYGFGYDGIYGLLGTTIYPNGVTLSNRFDVLNRATSLVWRARGGNMIRGFGYTFNMAGMVTNVNREDGGWTTYTYDSLDRLTSEKQYACTGLTYSASWTYDLAGNRTMAVTNNITNLYICAAGNILTNFGSGTLIQYDLAGNTTNIQYNAARKITLKWNAAYELIEARTNGLLVETYRYDALGRRSQIIAGAFTNGLIYDGPHVIAETSNNVLTRAYTYNPAAVDDILGMTIYSGTTTNRLWYVKDNMGSVVALVNTNGAVVEQYRYTAWGETTVLNSNGTVLTASAYGNRYTFQGREISWTTKLLFFRSRYYDARLGRWLSKDKIGISGGYNLYAFVNNCTTMFLDPYGLCTEFGKSLADDLSMILKKFREHPEDGFFLAMPVGRGMQGATAVEQYALKAMRNGIYPVMKRGFGEAVDWISMNAGDVWKYGTTKNPLTRYTQKFLNQTGLVYERMSSGTLGKALSTEKTKIVEYLTEHGILPPGNKIVR